MPPLARRLRCDIDRSREDGGFALSVLKDEQATQTPDYVSRIALPDEVELAGRQAIAVYELTAVAGRTVQLCRHEPACEAGMSLELSCITIFSLLNMLKSIEGVNRAAVLDGYSSKAVQLREFAKFNLVYGWNASGKTTFSRVVGLLEGAGASRLPSGAYAHFGIEGGILDTRRELDRSRLHVRVFNRDFIEDNLSDHHTSAPALLIVGSDNIHLRNRIAQLNRRRSFVADVYRAVKDSQEQAKKVRDKAATDLATSCGTTLGIRAFRSPDLKGLLPSIDGKEQEHLLDAVALELAISTARNQERFKDMPIPLLRAPARISDAEDIRELLRGTPKQNALKRLDENRELSDWIRDGLHFHADNSICAFCGNDATKALEDYAKHFSDEYQKQHAAITAAVEGLERTLATPVTPDERDWFPAQREALREVSEAMEKWYEAERGIRAAWCEQLREKLGRMDMEISVLEPNPTRLAALETIFSKFDALAEEHNKANKELSTSRTNAANRVKLHHAARYITDPDAAEQSERLAIASKHLDRVERTGRRIRDALTVANEALQRSSVAAGELNVLLTKILGSRVSVEQAEDGQLRFMRAGEPATNLSDGERTAVSLAYFLVSLKQNGRSAADTIVFIDDPICSLDANHIYDVAYLLLRQLGDCAQLFISTHNSEFFNTVKQEWTDRGKFRSNCAGYLMHRKSEKKSELVPLPGYLVKFRSDYHYVFHALQQVQQNDSPDIDAYTQVPNLLRRFLEMYLGFRVPAQGGFQNKLHLIIDDIEIRDAVARFADEGSHSQSTLRMLEYSDFPAMAKNLVGRVLDALRDKDAGHYNALVETTG